MEVRFLPGGPGKLKHFKFLMKRNWALNKNHLLYIIGFLWIGSLFFPVRKVFPGQFSYSSGEYSDFITISLYISQILLAFLLVFRFIISRELPKYTKSSIWLIALLVISIIANYPYIYELNARYLLVFVVLFVSYGTVTSIFRGWPKLRGWFSRIFVIFCSLEALLGIYQFLSQKSLGLTKLGESVLSGTSFGVSKIVSGGTFIRAYGTFPHPNVFGAFLVAGILINIWLILNESRSKWRIAYLISLILSTFALILTFSRSSWLALAVGIAVIIGGYIYKIGISKRLILTLTTILVVLVLGFIALKPLIFTRTNINGEARSLRTLYNQIGTEMIKADPLLGLGAGESMLHMQHYSPVELRTWEVQPIHNYYLLSAAELGIPAALALIIFFLWHLYKAIQGFKVSADVQHETWNLLLGTILLCFMILMLSDHYFYTLMQTQFLLWIILGLIAAEVTKDQFHIKQSKNEK